MLISAISGLPLKEPVFIFTLIIAIILLVPFIFKIFKIPDIAGYIITGIIIGPYGLNILERDASIILLGTVGLLYIMFIAGLELNLNNFSKNRGKSVVFGLSTFILPFLIGFTVCRWLFGLGLLATVLISIMFSTHTLIAYPVVRKLGIAKDISVMVAVGGTIITDTLVLLVLSFITGGTIGSFHITGILKLLALFVIYLVFVFFTYPRLSKWFFSNVKKEIPIQYIFLLSMVFISATLARLIGIEAIIGAFLAGLALNRVIPKNSNLFHNIDFMGNVLFIPVFLMNIGMLIDLKIIHEGLYLWYIALVLVLTAITGKWLAALITQKILKFNTIQRNVLFGLTASHAAATIAVILIGFEKNIIDNVFFNAVIIVILVTCLTASFVTEWSGRRLALEYSGLKDTGKAFPEKILVPVSNPSTIGYLIDFALLMKTQDLSEPVYVASIVNDGSEARKKMLFVRDYLEKIFAGYNIWQENIKIITRIDLNVTNGILRAAKELLATDVIIGWGEKRKTSQKLFGSVFDHLLKNSITLYVCNLHNSPSVFRRINLIIPGNTELETDFKNCIERITRLPVKSKTGITFVTASEQTNLKIEEILSRNLRKRNFQFRMFSSITELGQIIKSLLSDDLNILFFARKNYISYDSQIENFIKKYISENSRTNFILIVPGMGQDKI